MSSCQTVLAYLLLISAWGQQLEAISWNNTLESPTQPLAVDYRCKVDALFWPILTGNYESV